jgi:hypothetical protein
MAEMDLSAFYSAYRPSPAPVVQSSHRALANANPRQARRIGVSRGPRESAVRRVVAALRQQTSNPGVRIVTRRIVQVKVRGMAVEGPRAETERDARRRLRTDLLAVLALVVVIAFGLTIYGGYGPDDWTWTGYQKAQLWDWLHVLLLPIAFGLVAHLAGAKELGAWRHVVGLTCLGLFIALALAGYLIPWDWTGFVGNTVWDWLELVLLPLTLAILAAFHFNVRSELRAHHMFFITVFVGAIAVLAVGGYTQGWDWTGFEGNTLFDWLQLIFLPVVIPLVVIPMVIGLRQSRDSE